MIDFTTVTREFQSLVARRRDQMTFLGSAFAALSIFLQNALQGSLPPALEGIERHLFAFYAMMLLVPCLIIALRMARLHNGMVLNGILYARLMQEQDFAPQGDPALASRHNYFGVSFLNFLLADLLAGFAAAVLVLALHLPPWAALLVGPAVVAFGLLLYFRFHSQAVAIARRKIDSEAWRLFDRNEWEGHIAASREEANLGMLADIAFVGLILFSVFEVLSSLGQVDPASRAELASADVRRFGPPIYSALLLVVCLTGLLTYIRVRIAVGHFSLLLDPTDRPFRPLRLTDSLLGYILLAFLFVVSLHLLLVQAFPAEGPSEAWILLVDALAFALAIAAEQVALVVAGRGIGPRIAGAKSPGGPSAPGPIEGP